ncbi:MAG: hypothetical protein JSS27_01130 [Planctomycetes bacterium]|nr:hypothetical protein [Planctomycetota bacterium]
MIGVGLALSILAAVTVAYFDERQARQEAERQIRREQACRRIDRDTIERLQADLRIERDRWYRGRNRTA